MRSTFDTWLIVLVGFLFCTCQPSPSTDLTIGDYRGEFTVPDGRIPFHFAVEDDTASLVKAVLKNADERFYADSIYYKGDSVVIPFDVYDSYLIAATRDDSLFGFLVRGQSLRTPFTAAKSTKPRFRHNGTQSSHTPEGRWSVKLQNESGGSGRYAVGEFNRQHDKVTGTLLTPTGDYRYLEGALLGDTLSLSAFSGSAPVLLQATFTDSAHLSGYFFGPAGRTIFTAVKSDTARLPNPYSLTVLREDSVRFAFSFPDLEGKTVTLADEKYKGKAVIVTIMGTWCPNCVDEAAFLSPWFKANRARGVEIIGLSFERRDDWQFARERILKFKKRFDITYDILFAGKADKQEAGRKLPSLNAVLSFPTTLFIDRTGKVYKIHTGFSGPATGKYFEQFINEFNHHADVIIESSSTPRL